MTSHRRSGNARVTLTRWVSGVVSALALASVAPAAEIHDVVLAHDLDRVRQLLLEKPDLVNARTDKGDTPLYIASFRGYKQMVPLLLQFGADPNPAPNQRMETPLSIAREMNLRQTAETLIRAGAREDDLSRGAEIRYLTLRGNVAALNARLAQFPQLANTRNAFGQTPLAFAVSGDKPDPNIALALLNHGADPNATNQFGGTPYSAAVEHEQAQMIALLQKHGAKENAISRSAPLRLAARKNLLLEAEALLKRQPEMVNAHDDLRRTPLHFASSTDGARLVELLLKHGAEVDFRDFADNTPLHAAALAGQDDILAILLAAKADPNARNRQQATPLLHAATRGSTNAIARLLRAGADPKAVDNVGQTALHRAAAAGSIELVKLFLERGLDVNIRDKQRSTPLHSAAARGRNEVVKLLLERKANPTLKDVFGETPLGQAEKRKQEETAKLLRPAGGK